MVDGADRDDTDESQPVGAPELLPVDADGVAVVTVGTALWWVAFLVLLVFRDRLDDAGRGDWVWIALAGATLGLYGVYYCRRRRAAIRRDQAARTAEADRQA